MQLIGLDEAVDHILQACQEKSRNRRWPFFFLVGAGISTPPIPLSSKIIEDCKKVGLKSVRLPGSDLDY